MSEIVSVIDLRRAAMEAGLLPTVDAGTVVHRPVYVRLRFKNGLVVSVPAVEVSVRGEGPATKTDEGPSRPDRRRLVISCDVPCDFPAPPIPAPPPPEPAVEVPWRQGVEEGVFDFKPGVFDGTYPTDYSSVGRSGREKAPNQEDAK